MRAAEGTTNAVAVQHARLWSIVCLNMKIAAAVTTGSWLCTFGSLEFYNESESPFACLTVHGELSSFSAVPASELL